MNTLTIIIVFFLQNQRAVHLSYRTFSQKRIIQLLVTSFIHDIQCGWHTVFCCHAHILFGTKGMLLKNGAQTMNSITCCDLRFKPWKLIQIVKQNTENSVESKKKKKKILKP